MRMHIIWHDTKTTDTEVFKMINFCMRGASKAVGLSILAFCLGILLGLLCPLYVLAVIEMLMLTIFGYLCLCKW